MLRKSMETPPNGALTWPSSDVPTPNGMTGSPWVAQIRTIACTSSAEDGNATASGGWFATQVVVLACCMRTADETDRRSPSRCASAASAAVRASSPACGGGACGVCAAVGTAMVMSFASPTCGLSFGQNRRLDRVNEIHHNALTFRDAPRFGETGPNF